MMHMPSRMGVGVLDSGYIRPLTRQRIMCTGDTPVNELAMLVYVNLTSVRAATAAVNADRPADPDPRRKSPGRQYGVRCECPEWLLDLKEVTLGVQQQQKEASLLLDGPPAAYTAAKALPPSSVTVTVLNGSGTNGAAAVATVTLAQRGFRNQAPAGTDRAATTTIEYPAGLEAHAKSLAPDIPGPRCRCRRACRPHHRTRSTGDAGSLSADPGVRLVGLHQLVGRWFWTGVGPSALLRSIDPRGRLTG